MAKKFILNNDFLIIGKVGFHFQMVERGDKVNGGGFWHVDKEQGTLYLYSCSTEYGRCYIEDIKKAINENKIPSDYTRMKIVFSKCEYLEDAMQDFTVLKEKGY